MDEQKVKQLIEEALASRPIVRATVNAKDAAAYIGVCEDTLMSEVHKKNVPFTKLRGRYVFRLKSLDEWMDEQERLNSNGEERRSRLGGEKVAN